MWKPLAILLIWLARGPFIFFYCQQLCSALENCLFPMCLRSWWKRQSKCLGLFWLNVCIGGMTGKSDSCSQKCAGNAKSAFLGAAVSRVVCTRAAPGVLTPNPQTIQTPDTCLHKSASSASLWLLERAQKLALHLFYFIFFYASLSFPFLSFPILFPPLN